MRHARYRRDVRLQDILAIPDDYKPGETRPMIVTPNFSLMARSVSRLAPLPPGLTSVECVRSGLTQADACGLHPAYGQLK